MFNEIMKNLLEHHPKKHIPLFSDYMVDKFNLNYFKILKEDSGKVIYESIKIEDLELEKIVLIKNKLDEYVLYLDKNNYTVEMDLYINFLRFLIINYSFYNSIITLSKVRMQKKKEVETLMEISRELISTHNEEGVLNSLVFAIMGQVMITKTAIFLYDEEEDVFYNKVTRGFKRLPDKILNIKRLRNILNLSTHPEYLLNDDIRALYDQGVRLLLPMLYQDKSVGLIALGSKLGDKNVDETEYDFLFSLATNVAFAIENSRLIEASLEKKRMESELKLAKTIQQRILPGKWAQPEDFDIFCINIPSREVGGDYYNILKRDDKYYFVIADVTGKSIPAALLVSTLHSAFILLSDMNLSLDIIVKKLNDIIFETTTPEQFITFFIAELDSKKNILRYINAGHNYPYFLTKKNEILELKKGGFMLGIMSDASYETGELSLDEISSFIFYTDGITEAMNDYEEEFGEERLKNELLANKNLSAKEFCNKLLSDLGRFKSKKELQDDMTIIYVKKEKE